MELTPEKFEKAEFAERRRGYDIDQVESFLEETGTEFAQMLAKFRHTEQRAAAAEERASAAESRLAQTDAVVAEATERVQRAERAARAAQQQAVDSQNSATAAAGAASTNATRANEAAELEQAAKTLMMAQRTADATVNEARGQAQTLLEDARARADRQQAESAAEAEELVRLARLQAEEEYAARRAAVIEEVTGLEGRRAQLADVITQLEARLAGYRSELTQTASELSTLAEDPARLGARPNMSIPPDEVLSSIGEPMASPGIDPLADVDSTEVDAAVDDYLEAVGEPVSAHDHVSAAGTSYDVSGADGAPAAEASHQYSNPVSDDDGGSAAPSVPTTSASAPGQAGGSGGEYLDLTAPSTMADEDSIGDSSWGPGSWAQLEAEMDPDVHDAAAQDALHSSDVISATAATSSVRAATGSSMGADVRGGTGSRPSVSASPTPQVLGLEDDDDLVDDRPTQAVDRAGQPRDRFMQELDDAVNDTGAPTTSAAGDDAMTAFFEGSNESKTRRFGWRR